MHSYTKELFLKFFSALRCWRDSGDGVLERMGGEWSDVNFCLGVILTDSILFNSGKRNQGGTASTNIGILFAQTFCLLVKTGFYM